MAFLMFTAIEFIAMPEKNKKSKKQVKEKTLSALHCPQDMTPEQWQRGLRRQAARDENMAVRPTHTREGVFTVTSPKSGRSYTVNYYGDNSPLNRCECMDFKTSRLGVCKHIEAISLAADGRYSRQRYPLPDNTFVFVDYVDGRKIKIHIGASAPKEMLALADWLFDSDGVIRDLTCDPSGFIREATRLDPAFEWETDAMDLLIETRDRHRRRRIIAEKYASSYFDGLLRTTLHPYQADGVRFAFTGGRTINADEMGLGKTVQAIATAELLRRECNISSVIIICPTSLKYQWLAEIRKFTGSTVSVIEGNLLQRRKQFNDPICFYKICSFHAMSNSIKSGFIPTADMIVYDELQRLKNRETQMGRQLRKLQSQYVMALSGTPLENKLDELYSVTQLVDQYVLGPYYKFTAETTLTDETGKVVGYHNLHSVAERLKDTLIRRKKSQVRLQMPARTDTNLFVPMTKEQRAIHDDCKFNVSIIINKWRRFKFLSEADRKRLLLLLSTMRMVCDSTFILDQESRHDTKIDEIMAIVSNLMAEGDGKVVIFSQWERMLRILAGELDKAGIQFGFLHGGVPSPKRKALIDNFRDDPDCRVFLSTDAGATGLNLQTASLLVNIDLPWNPAVLEQRIARIYRLGQVNPVQIINMVARDTIEERMLSTLRFKSDLAAGILDGGNDAVFLEGSKFEKIIDVVDDVMNEPEEVAEEIPSSEAVPADVTDSAKEAASATVADAATESEAGNPETGPASTPTQSGAGVGRKSASEVRDIVAGGLTALGRIADVLCEPDGPAALAEALVKEDPDTGQASLNIPVPDKSTVVNLLSAFSALLKR